MPWHKERDNADCPSDKPYAVIKDDDGEVEGCHATDEEANAQIAALYASETEDAQIAELNEQFEDHITVLEAEAQLSYESFSQGRWRGVLAVEGIETGDARMFAHDALVWRDPPLTLYWQEKTADGHRESYAVGRIDMITRTGYVVEGEGVFHMANQHGCDAHRLAYDRIIRGLSVTLDDVSDSDIEMVWPSDAITPEPEDEDIEAAEKDDEPEDEEPKDAGPGGLEALFVMPEMTIFHHGRIMDVNFTGQPAMQEAFLELVPDVPSANGDEPIEDEPSMSTGAIAELLAKVELTTLANFGATASHDTSTSDAPWDGGAQEIRLKSPIAISDARYAYAWVDEGAVKNGEVPRSSCRFIHHEVGSDGRPGAANLTACSSGIGVLNGARGGSSIPAVDRRGVYNHLAGHLRDAGRTPPELLSIEEVQLHAAQRELVASGIPVAPPLAWFKAQLGEPTPNTVEQSGQCFGHLALWGTCHVGFPDMCVTPPHEPDYGYFTTGELITHEGVPVQVGHLTLGTGHAPMTVGARAASEHYDHTGYVAADVAVGTDRFGIWYAGAARPELTDGQLRAFRSASVSGDWRGIRNHRRLIGALMVNVPGFPIPRTRTYMRDGVQVALVASGIVVNTHSIVSRGVVDRIARSIGRDFRSRAEDIARRVHPSQT